MFPFSGDSRDRAVSLGGRSKNAESRQELLQKTQEERRKRQQRKQRENAVIKIQVREH